MVHQKEWFTHHVLDVSNVDLMFFTLKLSKNTNRGDRIFKV